MQNFNVLWVLVICPLLRLPKIREGNPASQPSSSQDVPVERAFSWRGFGQGSRRRSRSYIYGSCLIHACPRLPWVGHYGPKAGFPLKVCKLFFQKPDGSGKRLCWHGTPEELAAFPKSVRDLHCSLKARLQRGGRTKPLG